MTLWPHIFIEDLSRRQRTSNSVSWQESHGPMPGNREVKPESINHAFYSLELYVVMFDSVHTFQNNHRISFFSIILLCQVCPSQTTVTAETFHYSLHPAAWMLHHKRNLEIKIWLLLAGGSSLSFIFHFKNVTKLFLLVVQLLVLLNTKYNNTDIYNY